MRALVVSEEEVHRRSSVVIYAGLALLTLAGTCMRDGDKDGVWVWVGLCECSILM